ncbi:methyltransferase domain-containing protein [Candidatus Acetothermia bacterium]|nr:methyltransferase domain-containing protein [Candidatus Acetothermia bacterium]
MTAKPNAQATAKTQARYDRIAPVYDLMQWLMERPARKWRRLLWAQVEGERVLEVGVGTGKNMSYYPSRARVTAIDLSAKMLRRARRRVERKKREVDLRQMDAQALNFPDQSFDSAVASFVFCSVPDPELGLSELGRVTKSEGDILLLEHVRPENPCLGRLFDLFNPLIVRLFGCNINRRTLLNIERVGLEIERVQNLDKIGIVKLIVTKPYNIKDKKVSPPLMVQDIHPLHKPELPKR